MQGAACNLLNQEGRARCSAQTSRNYQYQITDIAPSMGRELGLGGEAARRPRLQQERLRRF